MDDDIGHTARENIEKLLRDVAAGQNFDDDTREELRAHMMEKFQDYKSGAEPVSDEDAFLLVREHFGNPAVVRAMYQETGKRFSPALIMRWFGAAVIVLLCVAAIDDLLSQFLRWLFVSMWNPSNTAMSRSVVSFMMNILNGPVILFGTLLLFTILRFWRQNEERGRRSWYLKLSSGVLISLVIGTVCLSIAFEHWALFQFQRSENSFLLAFSATPVRSSTVLMQLIYDIPFAIVYFGRYAILFWWFDRQPRHFNLSLGAFTLYLFGVFERPMQYLAYFVFEREYITQFNVAYLVPDFFPGFQLYLPFMAYLLFITYPIVRNRVITTVKTAGAYNV